MGKHKQRFIVKNKYSHSPVGVIIHLHISCCFMNELLGHFVKGFHYDLVLANGRLIRIIKYDMQEKVVIAVSLCLFSSSS